ncbi:copper amine oxidase N-terminal domain-containing protein [Paenibacillus sp. N4]|uniref:stalk domain-containing protein n=1 Tax=Paenibacillus vietnamensis TaxID=2590547 RepID=UPI001CD190EE|nr:stalk domain-containing protein [Paenibacillus vietnamensis]MCA0754891.1 copper amine oxidase N-terminal domain-containing protein [Paenibacillus vietnamensis]
MKKKLLITLAAGALMITSAAAGAYGATNLQAIKANLNLGLKFKIDGEGWTPKDAKGKNVYAITYNGTTYLPIRTAGEALGVDVGWDGANNTVWLGNGAAAAEGRKASAYNVDVTMDNGPVSLNITKVAFDPAYKEHSFSDPVAAIILDVTAENTSATNIEWYLDQSPIVLNTKEQIEDTLYAGNNDISSDFKGNVVKKGKLIYPVKDSKFEDISSIRLFTMYVLNEGTIDKVAEDKEVEILLK